MQAQRRFIELEMYHRDEVALRLLRETFDPETRRSRLSIAELAERLGCHPLTAIAVTKRLAGAGYIKKHPAHGKGSRSIEVLCKPSSKTETT